MADDEFDFASLMMRDGVQPIPKGGKSPRGRGAAPMPPPRPGRPGAPPSVRPQIVRVGELDAAIEERDAARTEARALAARVRELEAKLAAAVASSEALGAELAAEREASAAQTEARRDADRRGDEERRELQATLSRIQGQLDATEQARTSLGDALIQRGCADEAEMLEVLNGLLLQRPREFLDSLVLADPHALAKVLVDRVAFVSAGIPFEPDKNTVVVRVPKARCEICAGSDIAASFHGFVQACIDKDVHVVTIVGGSPAYRRQLTKLAEDTDDAPKLNLVSGTRRREARKGASDMRSSDVVVIWGGTELDHSVSSVYQGGSARLVRVAHRGIARMLQMVRSELRGGRT
jgi:hypothetical protein